MTKPGGVDLRLGQLLRQSHERAARALNRALEPLGITGRHFGLMLALQRDGVSIQRDLIRQTGSDKAGMTRTVDDLERLGFLSRTPSVDDRRIAHLSLTDEGSSTFVHARQLASSVAKELFAGFSAAELDLLAGLLERFVSSNNTREGESA